MPPRSAMEEFYWILGRARPGQNRLPGVFVLGAQLYAWRGLWISNPQGIPGPTREIAEQLKEARSAPEESYEAYSSVLARIRQAGDQLPPTGTPSPSLFARGFVPVPLEEFREGASVVIDYLEELERKGASGHKIEFTDFLNHLGTHLQNNAGRGEMRVRSSLPWDRLLTVFSVRQAQASVSPGKDETRARPIVAIPFLHSFSLPLLLARSKVCRVRTAGRLDPLEAAFVELIPFLLDVDWTHVHADLLPVQSDDPTESEGTQELPFDSRARTEHSPPLQENPAISEELAAEAVESDWILLSLDRETRRGPSSHAPETKLRKVAEEVQRLQVEFALEHCRRGCLIVAPDSFCSTARSATMEIRRQLAQYITGMAAIHPEQASLSGERGNLLILQKDKDSNAKPVESLVRIQGQGDERFINLRWDDALKIYESLAEAERADATIERSAILDSEEASLSPETYLYAAALQGTVPLEDAGFEVVAMRSLSSKLMKDISPEQANDLSRDPETWFVLKLADFPEAGFIPGYGKSSHRDSQPPEKRLRPGRIYQESERDPQKQDDEKQSKDSSRIRKTRSPEQLLPYDVILSVIGDIRWVGLAPALAAEERWTASLGFAAIRVSANISDENQRKRMAIWLYRLLKSQRGQKLMATIANQGRPPSISVIKLELLPVPELQEKDLENAEMLFEKEAEVYEEMHRLGEELRRLREKV